MAGLVVSGTLTLLFLTGANSLVQTSVPAELRGRVMSVYILVLLGGQSLGGPVVGWLTDQIGARPSMALCGASDRGRGGDVRRQDRAPLAPRSGDGSAPPTRSGSGPDRGGLIRSATSSLGRDRPQP